MQRIGLHLFVQMNILGGIFKNICVKNCCHQKFSDNY